MTEKTNLGGGFTFAGTSLTVNRIGYGAMQLAGQDGKKVVWGPPRDIPGAIAVLREAVASGVNHIDTSDFYSPFTNSINVLRSMPSKETTADYPPPGLPGACNDNSQPSSL